MLALSLLERAEESGPFSWLRHKPTVVGGGTERWYAGRTMMVMGVWKWSVRVIVGLNHEIRAVVILLKALRHVRSRGDG